LFTTWSTESGAVVMEGGRGLGSTVAPLAPKIAAARIRKSPTVLCAERRIERETAAMHYRS